MHYTMERWYSASGQRFSMRRYAGAPDEGEMEALEKTAAFLSGASARIALGRADRVFRPLFPGSGKVRGTDVFAAVVHRGDAGARCGYIGEGFILECTALGLGTCWLGASYRKAPVLQRVKLDAGEQIACLIAVGKPGEAYAGRPRKPLSVLTGLSQEALVALPEWQQHALSCARLAPSAVNAQPWRFLVEEDRLAVIRTGANFGFGALDQGIAMLHMELGASHAGVAGNWETEGARAVFVPERALTAAAEKAGA